MVVKEVWVGGGQSSGQFWEVDPLDPRPSRLLPPLLTDSPELDLTVGDVMKEEESQAMEKGACD